MTSWFRMVSKTKVAIVAALEREVWPLVRHWPVRRRSYEGKEFRFFERDTMVAICGGIGAAPARRAAEAVIQLYQPELLISAGFAGALQPDVRVGDVLTPGRVIDSSDGSRTDTGFGEETLVSFDSVANVDQKAKLARAYVAQGVDMEATAVARAAAVHGVRFLACKAISDTRDFHMPPVARFVAPDGEFHATKFAVHVALRPWLWAKAVQLGRNSRLAADKLCQALAELSERQSKATAPMLAGVKS
jgi:adenosylhomocysteine nucleosidase